MFFLILRVFLEQNLLSKITFFTVRQWFLVPYLFLYFAWWTQSNIHLKIIRHIVEQSQIKTNIELFETKIFKICFCSLNKHTDYILKTDKSPNLQNQNPNLQNLQNLQGKISKRSQRNVEEVYGIKVSQILREDWGTRR